MTQYNGAILKTTGLIPGFFEHVREVSTHILKMNPSMAAKINPAHTMAGPISGRQRAIVAVLRARFIGPIVRLCKIGHLRGFYGQPLPWYTQRQLTHSRPVLGPSRPLIHTGRQYAGRQSGPIGPKSLLMTLCPPNNLHNYILYEYIILYDNISYDIIPCDNIRYDKVLKSGSILYAYATPPLPFFSGPLF